MGQSLVETARGALAPRRVGDGDIATALAVCGGAVLASARRDGARGQPAALPGLAAQVLDGAAPPDAVAVGVGPGGFTGLRAAIALASGLAAGWGVPCHGVTTGEALAAALPDWQAAGREVWSVTTAGRGGLVLERAGEAPVLLTSAPLRFHVRAIADRIRPGTPVLAQTEIFPRARIRTIDTL